MGSKFFDEISHVLVDTKKFFCIFDSLTFKEILDLRAYAIMIVVV